MGLLLKVVGLGARATGRALSAHVVPDSLTPSWKTKKRVSSGLGLLTKAARLVAGKKKSKRSASAPTTNRAAAGFAKPSPRAPKKAFDKNGWKMGRGLPDSSENSVRSSSGPLPAKRVPLRRKALDAIRNPRAVARMGLDVLKADFSRKKTLFSSEVAYAKKKLQIDYQHNKKSFLSNLKHAVDLRRIGK